ncbi:MAG: transglutaminase-like domain-containing protein [Verrucomicrobiia bacterium]
MVSGTPGIVREQNKKDGSRQEFQWQSGKVAALPAETELPPEWVYSAGVGYFVGDVTNYLQKLDETMLERSSQSIKAAELARQLAAKAGSKIEAVKAIRDFVAKSIRAAGPSFTDLPLSELSDADTTLADGYGHAADRAILLHAMLSAAGFQPEFVLVSDLPAITGITNVAMTFPLPGNFQTPLVRITLDGTNYYLNDTDQYAQLGSTSSDGKLGITLSNRQWEVVHAARRCEDGTKTVIVLLLDESGRTRIGISRWYYGANYNEKHRFFSELPPEERKRYFQETVSGVAQGARPVGDLTTTFDTYPGREQFSVIVDNYGVTAGKYLYFNLPFTPSLLPAGADQRALPLLISHGGKNTVLTEIELPPEFPGVVVAPRNEDLTVAGGEKARITARKKSGGFVVTDDFETSPAIISPGNYQKLLGVESTLGRKSSKVFLLEQK